MLPWYRRLVQDQSLLLHLLLLLVIVLTFQGLLRELLGLFPDFLWYLLVLAFRGPVDGADPCHLQLELLVLVVVVSNVDDARGLLDTLL